MIYRSLRTIFIMAVDQKLEFNFNNQRLLFLFQCSKYFLKLFYAMKIDSLAYQQEV